MLFAVDLDGTIATIQGTDAYGEYIRSVLGIPIDPAWRHLPSDSSLMAALSRDMAQSWDWRRSAGLCRRLHLWLRVKAVISARFTDRGQDIAVAHAKTMDVLGTELVATP